MRPLLTVLVVLALAGPARADQPRTRDGLYLELGVGASVLSMTRQGHLGARGTDTRFIGHSSITGSGSAFELTLGGTLTPGFVLAGSFVQQNVANATLRSESSELALASDLHFALLAATVVWFPQPNGGLHLGGSLGAARAWARVPQPAFTDTLGGVGGVATLDAGYLWWISAQWSLGVSGRFSVARLHGEVTELGITGSEDDSVGAFMVAFSAAYH